MKRNDRCENSWQLSVQLSSFFPKFKLQKYTVEDFLSSDWPDFVRVLVYSAHKGQNVSQTHQYKIGELFFQKDK